MSEIATDLPVARTPWAGELWEDTSNLSFIGVTGVSEQHDVVLGYRFTAKELDHEKWYRGEAIVLRLTEFWETRYKFVAKAE